MRPFRHTSVFALFLISLMPFGILESQSTSQKRVMEFMDIISMRSLRGYSISRNGSSFIYSLAVPDWESGKTYTDLYLSVAGKGTGSIKQLTFSKDKNEDDPIWIPDGSAFIFASNRNAPNGKSGEKQLFLMHPDGGEARQITHLKDGISSFAFSDDGSLLAVRAGDEDDQLWLIRTDSLATGSPRQATHHPTPVGWWKFSPDSKQIYFLSPDSVDKANKKRKKEKFDVQVGNEETAPNHLWALDLETLETSRITHGTDYSIEAVTISEDSRWIGFRGVSQERYKRTIVESSLYGDLYLFDVASGKLERLTDNAEASESQISFSPRSDYMAFGASDDFTYSRNSKVYVRKIADAGAPWKKLGESFDQHMSVAFWSEEGTSIFFTTGIGAAIECFEADVRTGAVRQTSQLHGVLSISKDKLSSRILLRFSDPTHPLNVYVVQSAAEIPDRTRWAQVTDSNPQILDMRLGKTEVARWTSSDGTEVEGILVKPVDYQEGKRYPLVVQIHGGPASASVLGFNASYGYYSHVYAGAGYVCLLPNYRGSSNYGERFRMQISGDYFRQAYDDIMSGVDQLIGKGIVDSTKMGVMGWSAGGHWSNWILTHTDRFRAISSGAGASNWISMYAQTDVQRVREFYFQGTPYSNFEHFWDVSPLKYITNAKTPTLIHVVEGDPRVPRPQSEELYIALRKLGVPTEFFVYPGTTHGITSLRHRLIKMVSEFRWMEKWMEGKKRWFDWNELLSTLPDKEK